ncbi:hypothetical protein IFR05_017473, partial [Cadophora sp. M221]
MFLAHKTSCVYKSRFTLRNHIYDDFLSHKKRLKLELKLNCISISFTLDLWTAPNRVPIFAIIGHWFTKDFEEREEVLEFVEMRGSHTGATCRDYREVVEGARYRSKALCHHRRQRWKQRYFMPNCQSLYDAFKARFDDKHSLIGKPRMRFHGRPSWVRCSAHIIALICGDVLKDLKCDSAKEAKKYLDGLAQIHHGNAYTVPEDHACSIIQKVRFINLWALRSSPREQAFKAMPRTANRRPIYDVDARWNSMAD